MRGCITKRGDQTYLVRIFVGRDPATGKQKMHTKTIHGTKKAAEAYMAREIRVMDMGGWVEPSVLATGAYLDQWLHEVVPSRARGAKNNRWFIEHYLKPGLAAIPLGRLTPLHIQTLYKGLTARGLSPATIRRAHAVLSSALTHARVSKMIATNPARDVTLPKATNTEMRALGPGESLMFLEAAKQDRHAALWAFAIETGMRPGEYLGLRWFDLDLESGEASIQRSLAWIGGAEFEFTDPKTKRSRRRVPLSAGLIQIMRMHRKRHAAERLAAGPSWKDLELVFPSVTGAPMRLENLTRRHFKPILRAAGLPEIRLYDLRHTMATLLLLTGVNPKVVSERLGHASVALTLDTYSHVLPGIQEQATKAMQDILYPKLGKVRRAME